jgi:hypothetical protein
VVVLAQRSIGHVDVDGFSIVALERSFPSVSRISEFVHRVALLSFPVLAGLLQGGNEQCDRFVFPKQLL